MSQTSSTASYVVTGHGVSVCLDAPRRISKVDDDAKKIGAVFVGFWWVKETNTEGLANMKLKTVTLQGYSVPMMTNSKALTTNEPLLVFSNKTKKSRT